MRPFSPPPRFSSLPSSSNLLTQVRTGVNSFFGAIQRIGAADYVPDENDVLRARTKTTGISETRFTMGQLSIQCVSFPFTPISPC